MVFRAFALMTLAGMFALFCWWGFGGSAAAAGAVALFVWISIAEDSPR